MKKLSLEGEWKLSGSDVTCSCDIPGDFHSALIKNKIIKDPYFGLNEKDVQWVGKTDWTIERDFDFDPSENHHTFLEIKGADTFFTVFVNNQKCGSGKNSFLRYRFDVTSSLIQGKNHIKIVFENVYKKSDEYEKKLPYTVPFSQYYENSPKRNLIRKCQCHSGWDWGPSLVVSGIYDSISLITTNDGLFDFVNMDFSNKGQVWKNKITIQFDSLCNCSKTFNFKISGNDIEDSYVTKTVQLQKGKNIINAQIEVNNPQIWKTSGELKEAGLSFNELYDFKVSLQNDSQNQLNQKFAFSTLKAISKKDKFHGKDGRSLYFENNGRKIFTKGSNWIPCDALPSRMTEKRYADLIKSAVNANHNCLRVWGGGFYEKEIFYQLCDKYGIMVWQDCMFACSLYPATKDFLENVSEEIDYQIRRLQSHACISLWCGNNENFGTLTWFEISRNNRDRYLIDYDRLYNDTIGRKIKEIDSRRLFWPSSPSAGPDDFTDNWHNDSMGDMHYWNVWHERKSFDNFYAINPRFVSEFGYESFPSLETIRSFAEEKDWNFTSQVMEFHQRSPIGNSIMLENFSRYFLFPNGFENMLYLSQVQQALAIKTAVDFWRSLKPHCMGTIYWQLNDVWPCPSWSSLEYSGKWKLLQYESKKFYDIVYMPLFIKDNKIQLFVCNDLNEKLEAVVEISFLRFDGTDNKKSVTIKKTILSDTTEKLFEENIDLENMNDYFVYAKLTGKSESGKMFESENTAFPSLYKYSNIMRANITSSFSKESGKIKIKLVSDKPAFFVSLDNDQIPGRFSDNMFTLLPGVEKVIYFESYQDISIDEIKSKVKIFNLKSVT